MINYGDFFLIPIQPPSLYRMYACCGCRDCYDYDCNQSGNHQKQKTRPKTSSECRIIDSDGD